MLRYMYPDSSNAEIAEELERTVRAVTCKASELGLRKSEERLVAMGHENMPAEGTAWRGSGSSMKGRKIRRVYR